MGFKTWLDTKFAADSYEHLMAELEATRAERERLRTQVVTLERQLILVWSEHDEVESLRAALRQEHAAHVECWDSIGQEGHRQGEPCDVCAALKGGGE